MNNLWCTNYSSVRTNTRFTVVLIQRNKSVSYLRRFYFHIVTLDYMDFTLDYMDFTMDYMDFTLDYTEIHASDWSEAQSAQSRESARRGSL